MRKYLVIDACVACSADQPGDSGPQRAAVCRELLLTVAQHQYALMFTPQLWFEWARRESSFSTQWRSTMAKKRRINLAPRQCPTAKRELRAAVEKHDLAAMLNDFHLIEAALSTHERAVLSRDERARTLFRHLAPSAPSIRSVMWANPDKPNEEILTWVSQGVPTEPARMLLAG